MSRFVKRLTSLLEDAREKEIVDKPTVSRLLEMAAARESDRGVLTVAAVLSWLGGGILTLGVILLISANWNELTDTTKLLGFFSLFAAVHGIGIYLRQRTEMQWLAEGFNFIGAGLFIAGIGLISQIYQIEGRPPNAALIWLIAIAPLAWCFRSVSITLLSLFALVLWLHMEQFYWIQGFGVSVVSVIVVEIGVGCALVGFAAWLRDREATIAQVFRGVGLLLLFYGTYAIGFYRHMAFNGDAAEAMLVPWAAVLFGVLGLAVGYRHMLPQHPQLRFRLLVLLGTLLGLSGLMLMADSSVIPMGPDLKFFNFGWYRTFHATEWLLSIAAWVVWFALAAWCVAFAATTGRKAYLNAGVLGVGLGVITRFFDLVGGLFETGLAFVVGGAALLVTCFVVEYWRRKIVRHINRTGSQHLEVKA